MCLLLLLDVQYQHQGHSYPLDLGIHHQCQTLSLEVDQYDYTIFNGDLSYHLAYCYFREGKFEYATAEIQKCISYFITGEDRKKQKRAFGLAALTYSGQRLFEDADRFFNLNHIYC
jgi:hypothetical protein